LSGAGGGIEQIGGPARLAFSFFRPTRSRDRNASRGPVAYALRRSEPI
jgi:hypothetical protein